jgi:hypothetical protein
MLLYLSHPRPLPCEVCLTSSTTFIFTFLLLFSLLPISCLFKPSDGFLFEFRTLQRPILKHSSASCTVPCRALSQHIITKLCSGEPLSPSIRKACKPLAYWLVIHNPTRSTPMVLPLSASPFCERDSINFPLAALCPRLRGPTCL